MFGLWDKHSCTHVVFLDTSKFAHPSFIHEICSKQFLIEELKHKWRLDMESIWSNCRKFFFIQFNLIQILRKHRVKYVEALMNNLYFFIEQEFSKTFRLKLFHPYLCHKFPEPVTEIQKCLPYNNSLQNYEILPI